MIGINLVGHATFKGDSWKLRRTGNSHFDGQRAIGLEIRKFMTCQRTDSPQPAGDNTGDSTDRRGTRLVGVPASSDGVVKIKTIDGIGEVAHEIAAAKLAVCSDFKSEFLLSGENSKYLLILDRTEVLETCILARSMELRWPEKTSYVVGTICCSHRFGLSQINNQQLAF